MAVFAGWFRIEQRWVLNPLIYRFHPATLSGYHFSYNTNGLNMEYHHSPFSGDFRLRSNNNPSNPITLDIWHHFIIWYDATPGAEMMGMTIDGVEKTRNGPAYTEIWPSNLNFNLLKGVVPMRGSLDEIGCWYRLLTSAEKDDLLNLVPIITNAAKITDDELEIVDDFLTTRDILHTETNLADVVIAVKFRTTVATGAGGIGFRRSTPTIEQSASTANQHIFFIDVAANKLKYVRSVGGVEAGAVDVDYTANVDTEYILTVTLIGDSLEGYVTDGKNEATLDVISTFNLTETEHGIYANNAGVFFGNFLITTPAWQREPRQSDLVPQYGGETYFEKPTYGGPRTFGGKAWLWQHRDRKAGDV